MPQLAERIEKEKAVRDKAATLVVAAAKHIDDMQMKEEKREELLTRFESGEIVDEEVEAQLAALDKQYREDDEEDEKECVEAKEADEDVEGRQLKAATPGMNR